MPFPWEAAGTGTDQELLDLIRAAIAQIAATGQSYTINGHTVTRANLTELRNAEERLAARINNATSGPAYNLARRRRAS